MEQLPEPFHSFWHLQKELPKNTPTVSKEHLSKEWTAFLEAVSHRVKSDLHKK